MEERIAHLQSLVARLDDARGRLEAATDAAGAAEVLAELDEIAQAVSAEVDRQRRAAAGDDSQLGLL